MSPPPTTPFPVDPQAILNHLTRIEESEAFNDVEEQRWVLRFVVEETLAGRGGKGVLTSAKIAEVVFGEGDGQIARTHFGRLRRTLLAYYRYEPPPDGLEIRLPEKGYTPTFSRQTPQGPSVAKAEFPSASAGADSERIWIMPRPNRFFTGREAFLATLRESLLSNSSGSIAQPQAITGLGGIGKTQTAIEYAHKYRDQYTGGLWLNAESRGTLLSGCLSLANRLNLPNRPEGALRDVIEAVRCWLEAYDGWLLILDNVEDFGLISPLIPSGRGHCLITTQLPTGGDLAESIELKELDPSEGALLLLRRANIIARKASLDVVTPEERAIAERIAGEMGGLALALDQAGAFVEETASTLAEYLNLYCSEGKVLRARRGDLSIEHFSVTVTFSLALAKLRIRNPIAADLVQLTAFLAPDAIPEKVLAEAWERLAQDGLQDARKSLAVKEALNDAARFALIRRVRANKCIDVHRLVQEVIRDGMDEPTRNCWAQRAVDVLAQVFPSPDFANWAWCELIAPHAIAASQHIEEYGLETGGTLNLLERAGSFLTKLGRDKSGGALLNQAARICDAVLDEKYPQTTSVLDALGHFYSQDGVYDKAELLFRRALSIREACVGPGHSDAATSLNNLAELYRLRAMAGESHDPSEIEELYRRALSIREDALEYDHFDVVASLIGLVSLHRKRRQYAEAEALCRRALSIQEKLRGLEHPDVATSVNALAIICFRQGRYDDAELLFRKALDLRERLFGPEHPEVAESLDEYATLLEKLGRWTESSDLSRRSIEALDKWGRPAKSMLDHGTKEKFSSVREYAFGPWFQKQVLYFRADNAFNANLRAAKSLVTEFGSSMPDSQTLDRLSDRYDQAERALQTIQWFDNVDDDYVDSHQKDLNALGTNFHGKGAG